LQAERKKKENKSDRILMILETTAQGNCCLKLKERKSCRSRRL